MKIILLWFSMGVLGELLWLREILAIERKVFRNSVLLNLFIFSAGMAMGPLSIIMWIITPRKEYRE